MASNSAKKSSKKAGRSKRAVKDYPNIIEEPIRVIGEDERAKSKQRQSRKRVVKKKR